ncbi:MULTISPECIES: flavodoxin reductase [Maribacter]|uniref:Flavodoxin reductase n=1 Tax=Maribacter flavus TaxID=1658664 RepID=A0ABU7IIB1_9FLAO|nr:MULTISPECIES: flavodoxin reductase [Maribacter]MDC6405664.1 flavodoxin reductase [Maribacter sp. PR66]MEE1972568.1 flavodoxin reductase [Maribacter flavus]
MAHKINIQDIGFIRHNVLQIQTDRPSGYDFTPGQACEMSIDQPKWKEEKRPFTFTSLPDDGFLQFTIKVYPDHDGVTDQLQTLEQGDSLLISDSWGAISYQGPGIFLAGGAGVTPFIAIIKDLARKGNLEGNKLIFGNQRERDIILQSDFERWLGKDFINILSDEHSSKFPHGNIDKEFIKNHTENLDKKFYLCGPPPMMDSVYNALLELDVPKKNIITEDFD